MKKIIFSSYDDLKNPVYSGGGAVAVHEISKRLAKKNLVTVFTGTYKNAKDEMIDNVSYKRIGSDLFGHKIGQLLFHFAVIKHVIITNYDVWIVSTMPPFTFSLIPFFSKKPVIAWVTMLSGYDMKRKYLLNFQFIESLLSKLYKYFIVPTEWVEREITAFNKNAIIVKIPVGYKYKVHPKEITKAERNDFFLFLGRIEINQKGLDLLIKSLSMTKNKNKLIIAGNGSINEKKKLNKLINKYQLKNRVVCVGKVNNTQKTKLFNHAAAVIVPSRYETFGLVALEAISYQKPLICFDIPQLSWIPQKFAHKIAPFDTKELAYTIDHVLTKNSKKLTRRVTESFLKNFKWEKIIKQFEEFIQSKI